MSPWPWEVDTLRSQTLQGGDPALPLAFISSCRRQGLRPGTPAGPGSLQGEECAVTSSDSRWDPGTISQHAHEYPGCQHTLTTTHSQTGQHAGLDTHTHTQSAAHTHPGVQTCVFSHAAQLTHVSNTHRSSHIHVQANRPVHAHTHLGADLYIHMHTVQPIHTH